MPAKLTLARVLMALLLVCTTAGNAQQDAPCAPFRDGRVDPELVSIMLAAAEQGHLYRVDPANSRVGFCVDSHFMYIKGYFNEIQGGMAFDPYGIDADQILVLLPTDSLATNWSFIDNMLKGESFFDTRNYPDILFFSTGFHWVTPATAKITGQLTLHGVTRTVDFDVELTDTRGRHASGTERIRVTASTIIRRSDFGMDALQSVVDDSVQLCMEIEATQHRYPASEGTPAAGNDTASGFNE